ncbi:MAG: hypothetical protein KGP27_05095 [Hyphomicrobiales bacterium]|nr:hypothetical protein [Hyphomicrobiales bacterium]NDC59360.1 hypothetical protein [Alphaproteobacteria bacterium]
MRKLIILSAALAAIATAAAGVAPAEARGIKIRMGSAATAASTPKYIYVPRAYGSQNRSAQANTPRSEAEVADRAEAAAMRARAALEAEQGSRAAAAAATVTPAAHRLSARERQLPNGVVCVAGC